jgi:hypothetical protein
LPVVAPKLGFAAISSVSDAATSWDDQERLLLSWPQIRLEVPRHTYVAGRYGGGRPQLTMMDVVDVLVPASAGTLMRCAVLDEIGAFRISRRDCELYSVQIVSAGAWGRVSVTDGRGRRIFRQPSTFTGSFWLSAGALSGLIVHLESAMTAPTLSVNFRERDREVV